MTGQRLASVGDRVAVISGPHEGRSGVITELRPFALGYGEPEAYAVVKYDDPAIAKGWDEVAVPVRRLTPR